jgi:hypothetical protein
VRVGGRSIGTPPPPPHSTTIVTQVQASLGSGGDSCGGAVKDDNSVPTQIPDLWSKAGGCSGGCGRLPAPGGLDQGLHPATSGPYRGSLGVYSIEAPVGCRS